MTVLFHLLGVVEYRPAYVITHIRQFAGFQYRLHELRGLIRKTVCKRVREMIQQGAGKDRRNDKVSVSGVLHFIQYLTSSIRRILKNPEPRLSFPLYCNAKNM